MGLAVLSDEMCSLTTGQIEHCIAVWALDLVPLTFRDAFEAMTTELTATRRAIVVTPLRPRRHLAVWAPSWLDSCYRWHKNLLLKINGW